MDEYDLQTAGDITERHYPMIPYPEDSEDFEVYSVNQRRRYILERMRKNAGANNLNQKRLAEKFDVSRQMIYKDVRILRTWIDKHKDLNFSEKADNVIRWSIEKAIKEGDYKDARQAIKDWQEFLQEEGEKEKQPEKYEIDSNADFASLEDE